MSLDVYLTLPGYRPSLSGPAIFIREDGQTKEISRAEWDEKNPNQEPVTFEREENDEVYSANITHNLIRMAEEAGLYGCMWHPEDRGIVKAEQLIFFLKSGLALLKSDPERFQKLNPKNGWGTYGGLVKFVEDYLAACIKYPEAEVSVSR